MTLWTNKNKKTLVLLAILLLTHILFAQNTQKNEEWILAAMKFSFSQKARIPSDSEKEAASLIPSLILEQVIEGATRIPPREEMLFRTLETLQTERISLFLQLSKEIKARDAIIVTESGKSLQKKLSEADKKIESISEQIENNLKKVEQAKEENESPQEKQENRHFLPDFFYRLPFSAIFPRQKEENRIAPPKEENVSLYKNDISSLFTPTETVLEVGEKSREFEKAVLTEKINALITGQITIFGEYAAVTASLTVYPGCKTIGTVTEVGLLKDSSTIATNIARELLPSVVNARPVQLFIEIEPSELKNEAKVVIDGIVQDASWDGTYKTSSGLHTLEISAEGYISQTLTYNFQDSPIFYMHVPLVRENNTFVEVFLKYPFPGNFYADGQFAGQILLGNSGTTITVNGMPIFGQFTASDLKTKTGEAQNLFFFIPPEAQNEGALLSVNSKLKDKTAEIDKRRIWMYSAYTSLILSLPFAFYAYGTYSNYYNGYFSGFSTVKQVYSWYYITWGTIAVSVSAGVFFVYELIRYLHSASSVLPVEVKTVSAEKKEKADKKTFSLQIPQSDDSEFSDSEENSENQLKTDLQEENLQAEENL